MAIKKYKPTSAGRRNMSTVIYEEITKNKPEKSLLRKLRKHSGRDRFGHISIRHRGGGAKRKYRLISSLQDKIDTPATVVAIEYDPNRSGHIALIKYDNGIKSYILAPKKLKIDQQIIASNKCAVKTGNRMRIKSIPTGISIYDIEMVPNQGGRIAKSAGSYAVVSALAEGTGRRRKYVQIKMPSGEIRLIHGECFASIGSVSNDEHDSIKIGKAGRVRHMGRRPTVRGKAMNPNEHPHGGGEGVNPIGLIHPKTPWGKPALGYITRRNKHSDKFIIRNRRKAKRR